MVRISSLLAVSLLISALGQDLLSTSAGTITNDKIWKATNGYYIKASAGGHITLIDGVYYWCGNDPDRETNGDDIHIYSSTTLGSDDWTHVVNAVDVSAGSSAAGLNARLLRSPSTGKFVIVAKNGLMFYESSDVAGPYSHVRTLQTGEIGPNRGNYKIGGMSTFQEGNDAYVITSRRNLTSTEKPKERQTGIYKLTPDFLDVEKEILWLYNPSREAVWLFKRGATYYMTASHTSGWSPSDCFYRTAQSLSGPWSEEKDISMDPAPTKKSEKSFGSQCRWIMEVGDQWVFGGDRYPYESPSEYDLEKGHYIFLPASFDNTGHPTVTWQSAWTVATSATIQV